MPKPIVYESPKLTRLAHDLTLANGDPFVCIDTLTSLVEVPEYQEASELWIEVSTKQWRNGSGCGIWVHKGAYFWHWSHTREYQYNSFHTAVNNALDNSDLPKNQPVKIYFRLTYYD